MMKTKVTASLLCVFLYNVTFSQTIITKIEDSFNSLDSSIYFEKIILSYKEQQLISSKKAIEINLDYLKNKIAFENKQKIIDSIYKVRYPNEINANWMKVKTANKSAHYVLNLKVDSWDREDKGIHIVPDTSNLSFNLFYYDKRPYIISPIFFVYKGEYSCYDDMYRSFSKKLSRNFPKVMKRILKKNPKYLLYCEDLEGMNTILYLLHEKIYVYRIIQKEEYELNEYIIKFKPKPRVYRELEW